MAFTFFFRDLKPLEHAVHFLTASAAGRSRIQIWDAGCAMGPEPYTLAMLLAENLGSFAFRNVHILATDYDQPLLKTLDEAVFPWTELQRVPKDYFQKYFEPTGNDQRFRVVEKIRQVVRSHYHDLLSLRPARQGFSLVVCKNVLLHFQPAQRVEVVRMFHGALEPGGIFVMEHTQKMPEGLAPLFQQLVSDGQVFRKIEATP